MGRPTKKTADYFPHIVTGRRRTLAILERHWGNDGYAFWFKLLELLCKSDGHCYDCSSFANKEYILTITMLDEEKVDEIIHTLVELGKLDRELWENHKILWCQTLVDNLANLYAKRKVSIPEKPQLEEFSGRKTPEKTETEAEIPEKTEKPKKSRKESVLSAEQQALFEKFYAEYPSKKSRATAEKAWAKITPTPDEAMTEKIIEAVHNAQKYDNRFRDKQFTPMPASWLNAKGYLDEFDTTKKGDRQNAVNRTNDELSQGFRRLN